MQWQNLGLYNATAIKSARKKQAKAKRKAHKKALLEAARKALKPSDIQTQVHILAAQKARKSLGIVQTPTQYPVIPKYKPGLPAKAFYQTREWKELRYQAFRKHGNKCQCCGAMNQVLHVDHIKPRSKHPEIELELDNLQILCEPCNIGKSNKDATDWR